MGLLKRDERRALIDQLLGLPGINGAGGLPALLTGLPGGLQASIPASNLGRIYLTNVVDTADGDTWAPLPDGSWPILMVIENAADLAQGARLERDLRSLRSTLQARAEPRPSLPPDPAPRSPGDTTGTRDKPAPEFRYDAFISYSSKDRPWVRSTLLPVLERAGLRICIDYRDFELGAPSLVNIENAVQTSRKTLLVLTPHWVGSQWTDFEALLTGTLDPAAQRRRILPLLIEPTEVPLRLRFLTNLDLTDPAALAFNLERLVAAIRLAPA